MRLVSVYTVYAEKVQSQGRVDCIVETSDYVYIFEFKLDGTAQEALQQKDMRVNMQPIAAKFIKSVHHSLLKPAQLATGQ